MIFIFLLLLPLTSAAITGKTLYQAKQCQICHGETGTEKIQGMPRLWGQQKLYLITQMEDILSKKRDNNYSQLMRMNYTHSKSATSSDLNKVLTSQEIKMLSDYLYNLKP